MGNKFPILNVSKSPSNRDNKMKMAYHFLKDNYVIRINRFNPDQKEIISKNRKYDFLPTLNDINLHFFEEFGTGAKNILKDLLDSPNFMEVYNPVKEYFDKLEYKGISHMDLLMSCLIPKITDGKKIEKLNERMYYIFRKWTVACVACSIHGIPNHVALGLISEKEGIGKTRLARFLVPPHLNEMIQESNKKDSLFDFEKAFAFNFMVLFDECVGMNNQNAEIFKNKMTAETCYVRYRGQFTPTDVPRTANAIFTSNNKTGRYKGFLTESLGYRRFGCIELEKINLELFNRVDIDQVWAEAKMLYDGGYSYMWDEKDFNEFMDFNQKYAIVTNVIRVLQDYFEYPDKASEGEYMRPSDVVTYLKSITGTHKLSSDQKQNLNSEEVGKALGSLGFTQKRTGKARLYHVKKKNF